MNTIKKYAIEIWNTFDNQFGYRDEKIRRLKSLDEDWQVINMFSSNNKKKLFILLAENKKFKEILNNWEYFNFSLDNDEKLERALKDVIAYSKEKENNLFL